MTQNLAGRVRDRMVCHEYKLIYVHINRTGGTSIESAFNQPVQDHLWPQEIIKKIGKKTWDNYFKFTIVRNPWDRFVSIYYRRKVFLPFKDWIGSIDDGWKIQSDWIFDKNNKLLVDFVGRYENLQIDFNLICKKIGVNKILPHLNKSQRYPYWYYYDNKARKHVEKLSKKDIQKFGYVFSPIFL